MFISKGKLDQLLKEAKESSFEKGYQIGNENGFKMGYQDGYSNGLHKGLTSDKKGTHMNQNGIYVFDDNTTKPAIVQ